MNEQKETNDEQLAALSIGRCLRYERDKRGLSVAKIAEATRLSVATIKSLEADDYDRLPHQQVYVRGYIRSYCSVLGIDAKTLLGERIIPVKAPEEEYDDKTTEYHYRLIRIWGSLLVVSTIVVLIFLWWSEHPPPMSADNGPLFNAPVQPGNHQDQPLTAAGTPSEQQQASTGLSIADDSTTTTSEPPEPTKSFLVIKARSQCWAHIVDGRGQVIVNKLLPPGYDKTIYGYPPFEVRLGNAPAIDLWLDGEKQNLSPYTSATTRFAALTLGRPVEQASSQPLPE